MVVDVVVQVGILDVPLGTEMELIVAVMNWVYLEYLIQIHFRHFHWVGLGVSLVLEV